MSIFNHPGNNIIRLTPEGLKKLEQLFDKDGDNSRTPEEDNSLFLFVICGTIESIVDGPLI